MSLSDEALDQLLRYGHRELRNPADVQTLQELVPAYRLMKTALDALPIPKTAAKVDRRDLLK